jgi:hypothetical protein
VLENVSEPEFDASRTVVAAQLSIFEPANGNHRHVSLQLSRTPYYESLGEPWRIDRWEASDSHGAH